MKKVLVIGEVCEDIFIYCDINRLCPEAPVPVLNPKRSTRNSGMAANVIANLYSLSDNLLIVGECSPNMVIQKTRYLDEMTGQMICRIDENDVVTEPFNELYLNGLFRNSYDAVIISDYHKGFLPEDMIFKIGVECARRGVPSFLDTKKIFGSWSATVDYIKINEKEYNTQLKHFGSHGAIMEKCERLIVTLGSRGSRIHYRNNQPILRNLSTPIAVSNVSGAGDTYLAALVYSFIEHKSIYVAMDYANAAARIAVSKPGVVSVKGSEVAL